MMTVAEENWEILVQKSEQIDDEDFWEDICAESYYIFLTDDNNTFLDYFQDKEKAYEGLIGFTNSPPKIGTIFKHPFRDLKFIIKEIDRSEQRILAFAVNA